MLQKSTATSFYSVKSTGYQTKQSHFMPIKTPNSQKYFARMSAWHQGGIPNPCLTPGKKKVSRSDKNWLKRGLTWIKCRVCWWRGQGQRRWQRAIQREPIPAVGGLGLVVGGGNLVKWGIVGEKALTFDSFVEQIWIIKEKPFTKSKLVEVCQVDIFFQENLASHPSVANTFFM